MSEPVEAVVINHHSLGIKRNRNAFLTVLETGCLRSAFLQGKASTEVSFSLGNCQLPIVCFWPHKCDPRAASVFGDYQSSSDCEG